MDKAAGGGGCAESRAQAPFTAYTVGRVHRRFRVTLYTFHALNISRRFLKGRLSLNKDRFLRWKEYVS